MSTDDDDDDDDFDIKHQQCVYDLFGDFQKVLDAPVPNVHINQTDVDPTVSYSEDGILAAVTKAVKQFEQGKSFAQQMGYSDSMCQTLLSAPWLTPKLDNRPLIVAATEVGAYQRENLPPNHPEGRLVSTQHAAATTPRHCCCCYATLRGHLLLLDSVGRNAEPANYGTSHCAEAVGELANSKDSGSTRAPTCAVGIPRSGPKGPSDGYEYEWLFPLSASTLQMSMAISSFRAVVDIPAGADQIPQELTGQLHLVNCPVKIEWRLAEWLSFLTDSMDVATAGKTDTEMLFEEL